MCKLALLFVNRLQSLKASYSRKKRTQYEAATSSLEEDDTGEIVCPTDDEDEFTSKTKRRSVSVESDLGHFPPRPSVDKRPSTDRRTSLEQWQEARRARCVRAPAKFELLLSAALRVTCKSYQQLPNCQ